MDRRKLALLTVFLAPMARTASADDFNAIITNFGTATAPNARFDVSIDTRSIAGGPVNVLFDVYDASGGSLAEFVVPTNATGFASSAFAPAPNNNLFRLTAGMPALVRAHTPDGATSASATLVQRGSGARLIVGVPPDRTYAGARVHVGTQFALNVGEIRGVGTASLLVANVSGSDANVDVFVGTSGVPGSGKYNNPRLVNRATWRIDIQPEDYQAHLELASTGDVIVQLVIDDGRLNAITCLPVVPGS